MSTITTRDGHQLCYNDGRSGQPIAFSHGASLSAILNDYDDAPHVPPSTLKDLIDGDVLGFVALVHN